VSGGYFSAMGVPLLRGRTFTEVESFGQDARPVAILDDALARRLWPEGDAVGQYVQFAPERNAPREPSMALEVVGIVGSTRRDLFDREFPGGVYVPFAQEVMGNAFFHVRPTTAAALPTDTVRRTVKAAAPALPLLTVRSFADHIATSVEYWALRMAIILFGLFGGLAMAVALVGIYGVMSHAVERRTREIGVRLAVGATVGAVRRMILVESLWLTLAGVGIGWVLGIGVGRVLASTFVDVSAFDVVIFSIVPAGFVAAALAAAWTPARRATEVDPITALRVE
jgi:hypothetical protein